MKTLKAIVSIISLGLLLAPTIMFANTSYPIYIYIENEATADDNDKDVLTVKPISKNSIGVSMTRDPVSNLDLDVDIISNAVARGDKATISININNYTAANGDDKGTEAYLTIPIVLTNSYSSFTCNLSVTAKFKAGDSNGIFPSCDLKDVTITNNCTGGVYNQPYTAELDGGSDGGYIKFYSPPN